MPVLFIYHVLTDIVCFECGLSVSWVACWRLNERGHGGRVGGKLGGGGGTQYNARIASNPYIVGTFACIGGGLFGLDISSMSGVLNNPAYNSYFNNVRRCPLLLLPFLSPGFPNIDAFFDFLQTDMFSLPDLIIRFLFME